MGQKNWDGPGKNTRAGRVDRWKLVVYTLFPTPERIPHKYGIVWFVTGHRGTERKKKRDEEEGIKGRTRVAG